MNAYAAISFMLAALTCPALPGQVVQRYTYVDDYIYPVRTGLGIATEIELPPDEEIQAYSTGFSSGWDLGRRGNAFYVKPRGVDVDTNLLVRTATRSYIFELTVVASDWKTLGEARRNGVFYKVAFVRPAAAPAAKPPPATSVAGASVALVAGRNYNFDYDVALQGEEAAWLAPASVYDDGRFTYIRLRETPRLPSGNFPAVFMRDQERGEDALVNTSIDGRTIIVHGTYRYLVMRHGDVRVGLRRNTRP